MAEEIDYETMYNELKTESDAMKQTFTNDIETLKKTISDKDAKIGELQTYICKHITVEKPPSNGDSGDFNTLYKNAIKTNGEKK